MYFFETLQVRAPCHGGVLCIFLYWWNVVWIFYEFVFKYFFSVFHVFFVFYAISNIKKKMFWCKKKYLGGVEFFFRKHSFSFQFTFYAIFNINFVFGNIEQCPFIYWLNDRWFLQIVDIGNLNMKLNGRWLNPQIVYRDSGNLYLIYIQKLWC